MKTTIPYELKSATVSFPSKKYNNHTSQRSLNQFYQGGFGLGLNLIQKGVWQLPSKVTQSMTEIQVTTINHKHAIETTMHKRENIAKICRPLAFTVVVRETAVGKEKYLCIRNCTEGTRIYRSSTQSTNRQNRLSATESHRNS